MGKTVAVRQVPPGGGQGTLSFLLQDQLGSTVGTVDAVTGSVTRQQYWPYGTPRSGGVTQTDRLYTGQQQEAPASGPLGLYDYKARFYSTTTGEFISPDDRGLNRYEYVNDNPIRYRDPSGHCFLSISGKDLDCNGQAAFSWLECAMGMNRCSGALQQFAFIGVGQQLFWANATKFSEDACSCGGLNSIAGFGILALLFESTTHPEIVGTGAITSYGWQTIGHWFGVDQERFFMDSFNEIAYGSPELKWAGDPEIIGSYDWWKQFPVWNVLLYVKDTFHINTTANAELAESDWQNVSRDAAIRLGDHQHWSDQQRLNLAGVNGISPPAPDLGESFHDRIDDCLKNLGLNCFDIPPIGLPNP
jgi:RHS repeat-associated protein